MFEASIYRANDQARKNVYELSGSWSESWEVRDGKGKGLYTYDLSDAENQPAPMHLAPLEKQSPWESRRAWNSTAESLKEGDFGKALGAKSKLENGQREMRKRERAEGKTFDLAFFSRTDDDKERLGEEDTLAKLMEAVDKNEVKNILGGNGIWRFDAAKAKKWRAGQRSRPDTPMG